MKDEHKHIPYEDDILESKSELEDDYIIKTSDSDEEIIDEIDVTLEKEREVAKYLKKIDSSIELEDARQKHKAKQREAIKTLLESTGGNIPALVNKVSEELRKQMQVDTELGFDPKDHLEFTDASIYRLPKFPDSFKLEGSSDYFGMAIGEQSLLYERVGLFKGIVVDHSKDVPVYQGFRDVVKKEQSDKPSDPDFSTEVVKILYRNPHFSGAYDSSYTFSESEVKTQEIGISNFGISGSFSFSGMATRVAVTAGYSYGKQRMAKSSTHQKKIFITNSFLLPKIGLSFDHMVPCASDSFINAILRAVPTDQNMDIGMFDALMNALKHFGHFVPSTLLIGGKLYSTEEKTIAETSSIENTVSEQNATFQAAIETWKVDAGIKITASSSNADKKAAKAKEEAQHLNIRAIGGEGAFVSDSVKWVESLKKFSAWSLVKFDDLIPSLSLLPPKLYERCSNLITKHVSESTIEDLLEKRLEFLFYNGYFELFGKNAKPKFFYIQNSLNDSIIAVDGEFKNFAKTSSQKVNGKDSQLWWIKPDGKIVNKIGYNQSNEYALTVKNEKLLITQSGYFDNQYWELGGGSIKNTGVTDKKSGPDSNGKRFVVLTENNSLELNEKAEEKNGYSWRVVTFNELTANAKETQSAQVVEIKRDSFEVKVNEILVAGFKLLSKNQSFSLVIDNDGLKLYKGGTIIWKQAASSTNYGLQVVSNGLILVDSTKKQLSAVYENSNAMAGALRVTDYGNLELVDINNNMLWSSGTIYYSTIKCANLGSNLVLSIKHEDDVPALRSGGVSLTVQPYVTADSQHWFVNSNAQIISKLKENATEYALTAEDNGQVQLKIADTNGSNLYQVWEFSSSNNGAITNKKTNKVLSINGLGSDLEAKTETGSATWNIISQNVDSKSKRELRVKTRNKVGHTDGQDYMHMDKFDNVHTDLINIDYEQLEGLKFCKNQNRLVLVACYKDKTEKYATWNNNEGYSSFVEGDGFDLSPLYVNKTSQLGMKWRNDRFRWEAYDGSSQLKNDNTARVLKKKKDGLHFVELNAVYADVTKERIVGYGFTNHDNRLAIYLLVIDK